MDFWQEHQRSDMMLLLLNCIKCCKISAFFSLLVVIFISWLRWYFLGFSIVKFIISVLLRNILKLCYYPTWKKTFYLHRLTVYCYLMCYCLFLLLYFSFYLLTFHWKIFANDNCDKGLLKILCIMFLAVCELNQQWDTTVLKWPQTSKTSHTKYWQG